MVKTKKTKKTKKNTNNFKLQPILESLHNLLETHKLLGIGDFTHGCLEIPQLMLSFLQYLINNTHNKIILLTENSKWKCENIMNHKKNIQIMTLINYK